MNLFIITLAKYIFLVLALIFAYQNVKFVYGERNDVSYNIFDLSNRQFAVNLIFILLAGVVSLVASENSGQTFMFYTELLGVFVVGKVVLKRVFKFSCPILFNNMFFLASIGLIMLHRISFKTAHAQLVYFAVAMLAMVLVYYGLKLFKNLVLFRYAFLALSFILITLPFFFGEESSGSLNWISFKGISLQPSELVKITYTFFLATYFARRIDLKRVIVSIGLTVLLIGVLVFQNDFGASLMFFTLFMMIMYVATGSKFLFCLGYASVAVASVFAYNFASHIRVRFEIWQNPYAYPLGQGYQLLQSIFAITTYAPFGIGLYNGDPKSIPVVESDVIFSAISEEFGIIIGLILITIYAIMFYRGIHISLRVRRKELSYIALGLSTIFLFQTFLIIGGITKFIPLTGVTLPFVSYGGTSLVVSSVLIAILQFIHQYSLLEGEIDEADEEYFDDEEYYDYEDDYEDEYYDEEYVDYE